MHKLNESFCFAKISPSSWNFVLGLWLVWNCSMYSFDFFSRCRIFFLQGNVQNSTDGWLTKNSGKMLKDSNSTISRIARSVNCLALWSLSELYQRTSSFWKRNLNMKKGQMQNLILMGALYCIGVVFFITRFPESYWPGKFNLIFQSHQIFHVLVVR